MIAIDLIAAAIVFCYGLCSLNRMSSSTSIGMRLSWVALATGAAGVFIAPLFGHVDEHWWTTLLYAGIALHVASERRKQEVRIFR